MAAMFLCELWLMLHFACNVSNLFCVCVFFHPFVIIPKSRYFFLIEMAPAPASSAHNPLPSYWRARGFARVG